MSKKYFTKGLFYIFIYLLCSFAPLLIVMIGVEATDRFFWKEFSVALGFVGLSMMCLQFVLTARFQNLAVPFGLDMVIQYHKYISLVAFGAILLHPVILFWIDEEVEHREYLALLNIFEAPFRAQMAFLSVFLLFVTIFISVYRKQLRIDYEWWKFIHGFLAVLILVTAILHVFGVNYYLNVPWKRFFWVGIIVVTCFMLLYVRVLKPIYLLTKKYRVKKVVPQNGNAFSIVLEPVGHKGMKFAPGQFAWLTLGNSPFQIEEHPFSFSSSAENKKEVEMTVKSLGDYTSGIKDVVPGQIAHLDGPYGVFTPERSLDVKGYILLAGGVGITPMISMLRTFADRKEKRPLMLLYANNTFEDIIFYEEIERLRGKLNLKVVHILADPPKDWKGEKGFITEKVLETHVPKAHSNEYFYYICGPAPMIEASDTALVKIGIAESQVEHEVFNMV